ncbi:hypothetical protein FSP39_025420 [Pinctada imbricata]|uniref:Coactosin-like protein n=1 Tax=Pinctada imbricata TaxID=66713 RepID=A0AA89BRY2_PINIB|nr:hypothetical protein FSP39_025420 [Pinctada imbricata]
MSTTADFIDGANFEEAMKSVRSDDKVDNYLVVGHEEDDPTRLTVVTTGQDVEELANHMKDTKVMYALARYQSTFDMSNTVKFVYFHWIGENVPYVKKGRYGVVHGSVEEKFSPYHLFIETSNVDDFCTEKIIQQREDRRGALHSRNYRNRGPIQKAGFEVAKTGAKIEISPEVLSDIGEVRADDNDTRWCLSQYENGNAKGPIVSVSKGSGDISEMKDLLQSNSAMYGIYRVTDTVDDITTVKFVFITWVGNEIKPMTKAKIPTHKGVAEQTYGPYHVAIFATELSDISENIIMDKVSQLLCRLLTLSSVKYDIIPGVTCLTSEFYSFRGSQPLLWKI